VPLPEKSITWPPEHLDLVNAQIGIWAAWHSGDIDQLTSVYSDVTDTTPTEAERWRPIRKIYSLLRRWFWRQSSTTRRPRQRVHVPLAGDIAQASASLLFAEPPSVEYEDQGTMDQLQLILEDAWSVCSEGAEIAAALGGVYLRLVWDKDGPRIAATHPDAVVPEWRMGRLTAATVWRVIRHEGQRVVRHLERHESGKILHGVYVGSVTELGQVVPLTDYPETAEIAVTNGNEVLTGTDHLTCVYVPNVKPNRIWRHVPEAHNLGVSDYSGLETMLDALDLTYSAWMKAVDQSQGKIIVPRQYLKDQGPGEGAIFDWDQEVFQPIETIDGQVNIEQVQFDIPVDELDRTVDRLKGDIVTSAGYSGRTFGLDQGVKQATATEVNSLDSKDDVTRAKKSGYWRPALADILAALLGVGKAKFGWTVNPEAPLTISWGGGADIDPETEARTLVALEGARAVSIETKVKTLHPEWGKTEVADEVERIKTEHGIGQAEDPGDFRGGSFGEDQPGEPDPTEEPADEPAGE
jgi:A118 family predicted phage portal protein